MSLEFKIVDSDFIIFIQDGKEVQKNGPFDDVETAATDWAPHLCERYNNPETNPLNRKYPDVINESDFAATRLILPKG